MIVLGIDCGSEITGFGVVDGSAPKLRFVDAGAIRVPAREPLPAKLHKIFLRLQEVIAKNQPECVAIEDVFYAVNAKSALKLGHVRGVAMLAASSAGLPVAEYAPLSIKSAVVGYGKAEKSQVQSMVTRLLDLKSVPEPPDVADALAIAICHIHTAATLKKQKATARS
jgi:crossover junction endodeoxyribonuclease RuvC